MPKTLKPTTENELNPENLTNIATVESPKEHQKEHGHNILININRIFDSYATRKTITSGFFNIALVNYIIFEFNFM
jgi:hypothetical protein